MMGRSPHSDENGIKKGPWTPEEDRKLVDYIRKNGHESWRALPKLAGLNRCGKSCRLRWTNYLRPDLKRGKFSDEEEQTIIHLHSILGNKWSAIASRLPGRTDNEIKNYWNTQLKKKLLRMGIDPLTHRPITNLPQLLAAANITKYFTDLSDSTTHVQIANIQLLHNLIQLLNTSTTPNNLIPPTCPQNNIHLSLSEFLRMNCPIDHLIPQERNVQIPSSLLPKTSPEPPSCPFAELGEYKGYQVNTNSISGHNDQLDSSLYANPSTSTNQIPIPALVSVSSPGLTQMETNVNTVHTSNPSSTPNSFQAWDDTDLMGEETGDSYWKNFMDQASCQTWPFPE